ncbi:tyrosine-type recombinase/integrase [Alcanivoracaceae bacterium MT1]
MAPRPRSRRYKDLPDNLEADPKTVGGKRTVYYRYAFPDGRRKSLGKDKQHAIQVARALNEKLRSADVQKTVSTLLGSHVATSRSNPDLKSVIGQFREHFLATKTYSKKTREEVEYKLALYERQWGSQTIQTFTTLQIAEFLNTLSVAPYIKHRKLLSDLFSFAGHQGYLQQNVVAMTLKKASSERKKKRRRHTLDGYRKIHAAAPDWLQRAMDIALRSLQRRGDITSLHKSQVDMAKGTIRILQAKTEQYAEPVFIEIQMGTELRRAVAACLSTDIPCPYLIHYRPGKLTSRTRKAKLHPFAVAENYLTNTFREVRDKVGAYDHLPKDERPTFHDIRALGIWLYEKAGFPPEYINALSGHASDAMREHYAEGHEEKAPKIVRADLTFPESSPNSPRNG